MAEDVDAAKAAQAARRAAKLAMVCVVVAVLVLLIDNQIKRHIVAKAGEARAILDDFKVMADGRFAEAAAVGDRGEPGTVAADGVDGAAPGGPAVDTAAFPVDGAEAGVRAGGASGPRGNG